MDPTMAAMAANTGFARWATSRISSRSVLPGSGSGMIEESIVDTTKSPMVPKPMSQCKPCALWPPWPTLRPAGGRMACQIPESLPYWTQKSLPDAILANKP
jgi:hypothetical protein